MPEVGLEPTRAEARGILSPLRLPISPLRRVYYHIIKNRPFVKSFLRFFETSSKKISRLPLEL